MKLPSLAEYRDELLETMPAGFVAVSGRESAPWMWREPLRLAFRRDARVEPSKASPGESTERAAQELFEATSTLHVQNSAEDTVAACDEMVRRFGDSEIPGVLEMGREGARKSRGCPQQTEPARGCTSGLRRGNPPLPGEWDPGPA